MRMRSEISDVVRIAAAVTVAAMILAAALFLLVDKAVAGDHRHDERHESKLYGLVERLPENQVGIWIVNGREITVDRNTVIKEKHGKAEVGAYVKIEGYNRDKAFVADEVEVKQAKGSR